MGAGLTRRGVLWLGMKCDVRCSFCYQENMPASHKRWVPVDDLKLALDKFRGFYQNGYVDFMGGEPTLHPDVYEVVAHASEIGCRPTIITHGMRLADPAVVERFRDAGIHDFLVSVHGIGDTLRAIHGRGRNNFERQVQGLENLRSAGVPFRFNVTVVRDNLSELEQIAALAAAKGARVVNFLTFNPYFEWTEAEQIPFQVAHTEAAPHLMAAIDVLRAAGIEANVRYFPICLMPGYEEHVFTGHQLPYDTHEWDYNAWYDLRHRGAPDHEWYRWASRLQRTRNGYVHAEPCQACSLKDICDGLHEQYVSAFGEAELRPVAGEPVVDPAYFIDAQPDLAHEPPPTTSPIDDSLAQPLPLTQFREDLDHRAGVDVQLRRLGAGGA